MRSLIISLALVALCMTVGRADRATFDETKTQIALPLSSPPASDGIIDDAEWNGPATPWAVTIDPNLEDGIRGGNIGDGSVNVPVDNNDLSFRIYARADNNNLYIAVRVTDDVIQSDDAEADSQNGNTWMDDSVEVFIDGDNSNFETRETSGTNPEVAGTGGQFVITANNAYREAEAGNPGYSESAAWFAKTSITDTGYDAEFRISLAAIGNPKAGDIIGFTVGVNDDDDGGAGEHQLLWVGMPHTEATYGNLVVGGKSYAAPKTSAPTVDGTINSAEYAGAAQIKVDTFNAVYGVDAGDDIWPVGDHAYSAWIVHDDDAIYVAVDVTDDNVAFDTAEAGSEDQSTWEDDSVEIFFDADHDHEPGRGGLGFEGQYVLSANGAWRDNEANNPTFGQDADWFAATSPTAGGYQVEFKVKKASLSSPPDGADLGFHIAINDDDGAGRKAQVGWSGHAHQEFTYGHLTLSAPASGGSLSISNVRINGNNLELTIATSNASGTHAVQQSGSISPAQWSDVPNVTFTAGQTGTVVATFPKPSTSPAFFRVTVR
jgi:hypothetical protein